MQNWIRYTIAAAGFALGSAVAADASAAEIERIWLTHRSRDSKEITLNWESPAEGASDVAYGPRDGLRARSHLKGRRTLHHVEVRLPPAGETWDYVVRTGDDKSKPFPLRAYPTDVLRVAVVANWQSKPKLDALHEDDVHLLLTAGDNVPDLHSKCGVGTTDCVQPYRDLVDRYPLLFQSTPFLPILGNHDREIRPRGAKPPEQPVYDVEAAAFRSFFALPDDEWKWTFELPQFDVRFIGLDLNHVSDQGTTWQTCHPLGKDSEQLKWYQEQMAKTDRKFVVTLENERSSTIRAQAEGEWGRQFRKGTALVSGFGYFAERADDDGFPYLNTSLGGTGAKYPDPKTKFFASQDNYLLMTFAKGAESVRFELKGLDGAVLDRIEVPAAR